ncbi:hypothetical protein ACWKT3_41240 [Streptomyces violaceus]
MKLAWDDDTDWSYANFGTDTHDVLLQAPVTPLRRVFACPEDVADVADGLVRHWRTPAVRAQRLKVAGPC